MVSERNTSSGLAVAWYSRHFMRTMAHSKALALYHCGNCGYYYNPSRTALPMASSTVKKRNVYQIKLYFICNNN